MDEKNYEIAFQLIMNAGNSKSASVMAQEAAKKFDFERADQHLKEAELEMRKAHQCQIDMIQQEAQGTPVEVNIILVHAQDHLTMAMMAMDQAKELIEVYKILHKLMKQGEF